MKPKLEMWMVELPNKALKCFGIEKDKATAFAKEMGEGAMMWDMMSTNTKDNHDSPKENN